MQHSGHMKTVPVDISSRGKDNMNNKEWIKFGETRVNAGFKDLSTESFVNPSVWSVDYEDLTRLFQNDQ